MKMATSPSSLSSSSEALPASDSDMSADESTASVLKSRKTQDNRIASLQQANRVLKVELEMYKLRCKQMQGENKMLRQASVSIQAKAEQEEEFISNTLMKKIHTLKKEKEILAMNYEQEEEYLTNDLSKKLLQLRQEKVTLEQTLEREQEFQVNKLIRKIERLEAETVSKQQVLEQLRKEKIDLENTLEQEQEALVNRLWIRMEKLETEKRLLQEKLDQPVSEPVSPRKTSDDLNVDDLSSNVSTLRNEVKNLRHLLASAQAEHQNYMSKFEHEESNLREENVRLQRKLLLEMERREHLSRQLSESESSLEMDDERHFNELAAQQNNCSGFRDRAISSPIPYPSHRPKSPSATSSNNSTNYPTFTPPSPLGARGVTSATNVAPGSSPPFPTKSRSAGVIPSPNISRKSQHGANTKERPTSGQ